MYKRQSLDYSGDASVGRRRVDTGAPVDHLAYLNQKIAAWNQLSGAGTLPPADLLDALDQAATTLEAVDTLAAGRPSSHSTFTSRSYRFGLGSSFEVDLWGRVRAQHEAALSDVEATREDAGAVALVGIDKNRVFALGWGLGAALVGLAGAIMSIFFYIYPDVGASFALIAYVTVALGGFGSVFGAFAGGIIVGLVEATTAMILPPSLKSVGIYAVYLRVVFVRPRGLFGKAA